MLNSEFEIIKATTVKGHRFEKTKDYEIRATIKKNNKVVFDEVLKVRKNAQGIFWDMEIINKKIKSIAERREIADRIKEFMKKAR